MKTVWSISITRIHTHSHGRIHTKSDGMDSKIIWERKHENSVINFDYTHTHTLTRTHTHTLTPLESQRGLPAAVQSTSPTTKWELRWGRLEQFDMGVRSKRSTKTLTKAGERVCGNSKGRTNEHIKYICKLILSLSKLDSRRQAADTKRQKIGNSRQQIADKRHQTGSDTVPTRTVEDPAYSVMSLSQSGFMDLQWPHLRACVCVCVCV
jgi:hypothetical protein